MEGRLAELGAERDALAERVRDLGKQLDGANALLYDAARACDALGGAVGLSAPEGDGEVDGAHVADRLQRVSRVVQEQAEEKERWYLKYREVASRREIEVGFACAAGSKSVEELFNLSSLLDANRAESEVLRRCLCDFWVVLNQVAEDICHTVRNLFVVSRGDACVCNVVDVPLSNSGIVDLVGFSAGLAQLRRFAAAWRTISQSERESCGRYERVCESLQDVFVALGVESPDVSVEALRGAREEALRGVLTWVSDAVVEAQPPLSRYAEATADVLGAVEAVVQGCVESAVARSLELHRFHDAVVVSVVGEDAQAAVRAGADDVAAGAEADDDPVLGKIHQLQLCVKDMRESLVTSITGDVAGGGGTGTQRPPDELPLEKRVKELQDECEKAAAAFAELRSILCSDTEEKAARDGNSGSDTDDPNSSSPVCGYDDLVALARRCVMRVSAEREKNKQLCEELCHVLTTAEAVADSSANCLPPGDQLQRAASADSATEYAGTGAAVLACQKTRLLMPIKEFVDANDSDQTPTWSGQRESLEIVHQVKNHIDSRAAEVRELRTAVTTSVETLGGEALSDSADSRVIANMLLDLVRETSSSISEVHAIIDPDAAAVRSGPLRLRDLVGRLEEKVEEWEKGMREARLLVDSVMHMNDPNFTLVALPGRTLTRKAKPQPVMSGKMDDSLSLRRMFPSLAANTLVGQPVSEGATSDASSRRASSAVAASTSNTGNFELNVKLIHDAVLEVRTKLFGIRQLTNACATAVCLMGSEELECQALDTLPVRLLQKAQEVSEVIQLTKDAVTALDGGYDNPLAVPSTLLARVERLIKDGEALRNENGTLRLEGDALQMQKAFLLRDFEEVREKHAWEEQRLSEAHAKLLAECDELRGTIDNCMRDIRQRDDALAQQRQRSAGLQEECDRLHAECELLQRQLVTVRATRDDLQASELGLRDAAVMVRRASAFVYERLHKAIDKPTREPSSHTATPAAAALAVIPIEASAQEETQEHTVQVSVDRDTSASAAQLLAESGRDLRLCGQALQQLGLRVRTQTQLRNWVLQMCEQTKGVVVGWEAAEHALLLEAFHDGVLWLNENVRTAKERDGTLHSLQKRLKEELSRREEERAVWQRRLRDLEDSYAERGVTLQRCTDSLRDGNAQRELLRAEAENWRRHAEAAADRLAAAHAEACKLRQQLEELRSRSEEQVERSAAAPIGGSVGTESCGTQLDWVPVVLELVAAVGGDRVAEEVRLGERLTGAVKCARRLSKDRSRCRALLQEELLMMGDDSAVSPLSQERQDGGEEQRMPLAKLMARHKSKLEELSAERVALREAWQAAQHDASQLHRALREREEKHARDTEEMGRCISDLRALVQRKLEADARAEEQMENIQFVMDQHLAEMCKHAAQEAAVTRHLGELRRLLRSKTNIQKGARMCF
ncbi:hypothetical protein TraAM80_06537 [Trypanosoma rangeli]|uniref:Uncharacterized protein n=1 Tax=Trypanosoma rangeli TaxID=5698 RepID=A0A422N9W9_TRYRA|nr:uncharacterized protein TraAM80_06537 [Trypanosoma rangeli]RNF02243.1 hypothetical protein TraAM80_06537 [Trypanosoma rangeli]|eukprot:RNF02243.1 hypothetical protein TraAM80_06537 [Trypanosoma rangeli]